jgi:hypothetical protein
MLLAARHGTKVYNASTLPNSRLLFPRVGEPHPDIEALEVAGTGALLDAERAVVGNDRVTEDRYWPERLASGEAWDWDAADQGDWPVDWSALEGLDRIWRGLHQRWVAPVAAASREPGGSES